MKNNIASKERMNRGRIGRPAKLEVLNIALLPLAVAVLFLSSPLVACAADTCGLLTSQQISAATHDPVSHTNSGPSDCIWSGKKSRVYITTRDSSTWSTAKNTFQTYGQVQTISGVGDDAYFLGSGPKPTLYAIKGRHAIILRVNVSNFSADQTKAALKALANDALAHL